MLVPESDVIPSLLCTYPFSPTHFMIIFFPIGHPVGNTIGEEELTDELVQIYTSSDTNGGLVIWSEDILTERSFPNCSICCICASEKSSEGVEMHLSLSFSPKYSIRNTFYFITITRYVPLVGAVPNRRTTPALSCLTSTRHSLKLPSELYLYV